MIDQQPCNLCDTSGVTIRYTFKPHEDSHPAYLHLCHVCAQAITVPVRQRVFWCSQCRKYRWFANPHQPFCPNCMAAKQGGQHDDAY